jgi:hypothetical protein
MRHPLADVPSFMSSDLATCQYDASPSEALAAVRTHQGPLLVDVDETLYLRNSTEDFAADWWHRHQGHLAGMRHFDLLSLDALALERKGSSLCRTLCQSGT